MALRRRLPLDHDGLVGPAAGDDVLGRSAGGLLRERDTEGTSKHTHMKNNLKRTFPANKAYEVRLQTLCFSHSTVSYLFVASVKENPDRSLCDFAPPPPPPPSP